MNKKQGKAGEPPKNPKMPPAKSSNGKSVFKTGVSGKVWGTQNDDWVPSLMLNPIR